MKIKKLHLYALLGYSATSLYFLFNGIEAFILFAILSPIAGIFIYAAVRKKHIILSLFAVFFFLSNAIGPSFFFLNKDHYTYSGWTAVKDFNFEISSFLEMYLWVYILMFFIVAFTLKLDHISSAHRNSPSYSGHAHDSLKLVKNSNNRKKRWFHSFLLTAFIIFLAIPLSIFMFKNQLGIVGLEQTRLPFKLTGILYFFRSLIIPVIIFYLYLKSNRSLLLCMIVLMYAVCAGLSGVSRFLLIMASVSVSFFALIDRQYIRFGVLAIITLLSYQIISAARGYVYAFEGINFYEIYTNLSWGFVIDFIRGLSERLGSAQDVVLAYQYHFDDRIGSIIKFFSTQPLMENSTFELYGFNLPEDMAYGIGFSLIPSLIMFVDRNIFVLILLAAAMAFLVFLSEEIVRKLLSLKNYLRFAAYPLSLMLAMQINSGGLNGLYLYMLISIIILCFARISKSM